MFNFISNKEKQIKTPNDMSYYTYMLDKNLLTVTNGEDFEKYGTHS